VKNAADEKRVITDVRAQQKRLLGSRAGQRDEHVRDILLSVAVDLVRHLQSVRARKSFEQRRHVIAQFTITDPALLQNVPGQHIKIKLRRNPQMSAIAQNGFDQSRMIENGIARFEIAQKIDKGDLIGLGARERTHDEVEISGRKPRPTIRSDHRERILRKCCVYGKPNRQSRMNVASSANSLGES